MIKLFFKVNNYSSIINLGLLVLRLVIGYLMLLHGLPKLGKLLEGDFNFSNPVGLGSTLSLILVAFAEAICSILIAIGLGTRFAAIPLIITMIVILFVVHGDKPLLDHYNVILYLLGYITLLITGSGKYSIDYLTQKNIRR